MNNTADFTIENGNLEGYSGSETDVIVPNSVTSIRGLGAFCRFLDSDSPVTSVTIPESVTIISASAFSFCRRLTRITVDPSNSNYSSDSLGVLYNKDKTELIRFPAGNTSASFAIPDKVTKIDSSAFTNCQNLTSITVGPNNSCYSSDSFGVLFNKDKTELIAYPPANSRTSYTIPGSVKSIGSGAFDGCKNLTDIVIPKGVTTIGFSAFEGCGITSIVIPEGVTRLNSHAFKSCVNLAHVTISDGVKFIGYHTFSDCNSLNSLLLPGSITDIGDYAFADCADLTNIVIPDSVTSIGEYAFNKCKSLTSIVIPDSVTNIAACAFARCTSLTNVSIPDSITIVNNCVFYGCTSLTGIEIPDSVTSIGKAAFYECRSLTSIVIPDSVTSIGDGAFSGCINLKSIVLPSRLTSISPNTFNSCGFSSITIPDTVTSIGKEAFRGCDSLANLVIPDSVTSIGERAFCGCSSLASAEIPNSVTSIGKEAFRGCDSLANLVIPDSVTSIGDLAFLGVERVFYNPNVITPGRYGWGEKEHMATVSVNEADVSLTDFEIKDGNLVHYSGTAAYVTIPECVKNIDPCAFECCTNLTDIAIGNNVSFIAEGAFFICEKLKNITIGSNVTYIDEHAFPGCEQLERVNVVPENTHYMSDASGVLYSKDKTRLHYFPAAYKGASYILPENVTSIAEEVFSECQSLEAIVVNSANSHFSSDGCCVLFNKSKTELIQFPAGNKCTNYTVPDGVTNILGGAFSACQNLQRVTIPASVTSIDTGFSDNLTHITVCSDNSLYSSDSSGVLFHKGESVLIRYPASNKSTHYTVPNGVTNIGPYAFSNCHYLKSIKMPNSVTSIDRCAFCDCNNLSEVTIPDSVTKIGESAFSMNIKLSSIVIPDSVTNIGDYAFFNCMSLCIEVPDSITDIGKDAFLGVQKVNTKPGTGTSRDYRGGGLDLAENAQPKVVSSAEYKFCRKCGNKLPSDSFFCDKCGTKIDY